MTDTTLVDPDALLGEIMLTAEGRADPYVRYAAIREQSPVFRSALGMTVISRYEDCQALLHDGRFGKGPPGPVWEQYDLTEEAWQERFGDFNKRTRSLLSLDPPDHTRLRKLVAKAFTPRTVERLRPDIVRLTDELLDQFDGVVDVMSELALQLPMNVIGEMLGVPSADRETLRPLVRTAVATLELTPSLEQMDAASVAARGIHAQFEELITFRRKHPTDDLLSELVHVEEEGDKLTHEELLATVMLLFGAGFETTTNLIGNGLLALLEHPHELQRLRDDRSLVRSGVEELLGWDSPVQLDGRQAFEDVDLHGTTVEAGSEVITLLGAANRDPRVYDDPDRLDVGRDALPPMSFGSGIHYCLGASLARAEGQVVFDRLLDRFDVIEPAWDDRPAYRETIVLRGLESLPVRFG